MILMWSSHVTASALLVLSCLVLSCLVLVSTLEYDVSVTLDGHSL